MRDLLICFLKYPQPGHVKTRLAEDLGSEGAAALYEALAERVITEIYPLSESYDLILCAEPSHAIDDYRSWIGPNWIFWYQEGETLGDRLAIATESAFHHDYQRIIVIGTDCIGMDEPFIEKAFNALEDHDVVIGPSTDGGYYLLGISQPMFWLFEDMPWSTEKVLSTTIDRIEARELKHRLLEEKIDVDTMDDLVAFRQALPEEHFLVTKIDHIISDRLTPPENY